MTIINPTKEKRKENVKAILLLVIILIIFILSGIE